ncbi:hypothetical protein HUS62_01490 [Pseudoalteromonas sp. 0303]|nr:hypothetical protein [Pseudoalteromonas sp. 0303]
MRRVKRLVVLASNPFNKLRQSFVQSSTFPADIEDNNVMYTPVQSSQLLNRKKTNLMSKSLKNLLMVSIT